MQIESLKARQTKQAQVEPRRLAPLSVEFQLSERIERGQSEQHVIVDTATQLQLAQTMTIKALQTADHKTGSEAMKLERGQARKASEGR